MGGNVAVAAARKTRSTAKDAEILAIDQESPETAIYNKIHRAIAERRLLPGSRLIEDQLAEVFGVSRMRIRWVLQSLARDKVVTLHKNRGACVAEPTVKEAKEVFAARRLLEGSLARDVIRATDEKALKRLKAHIKKEITAEKSHDRAMELRTSHEFHTLLAEIVGNSVIVDFLRELMARSALITAIFERPDVSVCSHFTHSHLIELIEKRDEQGLVDAMLGHLDEIESYLTLYEKEEQPVDIKTIFSSL
jgi:DNA-binding GntR family transcriptional regulator